MMIKESLQTNYIHYGLGQLLPQNHVTAKPHHNTDLLYIHNLTSTATPRAPEIRSKDQTSLEH
jgi:hypothetical protein